MSTLMPLRDRRKLETRRAVLDAASALYAQQGFEATTTRAIAARAGVAAGTVFAHFPDKDALVEALLHARVEPALTRAFDTLPPGGLVAEQVHVATTLYGAYDAHPDLARVLVAQSLFPRRVGGPMSAQLARLAAWSAQRLRAAIDRGEVPPVDPGLAWAAFFSHYFAVLVAGLRGELPPDRRGPLLAELLRRFHGLPEPP